MKEKETSGHKIQTLENEGLAVFSWPLAIKMERTDQRICIVK